MDFPLKRTSSVSRLYLLPLHDSQGMCTSGRKSISINFIPPPSQFSHLPPFTLNENLPGLYPLIFASGNSLKRDRISVKTPVYVAGFERGVLPMGDWSTSMTLSTCFKPTMESWAIGSLRDR